MFPQYARLSEPFWPNLKQSIPIMKALSGIDNGDGGIETLVIDVKWEWKEAEMSAMFPPNGAAQAWQNLRKLHISESDGVDRFLDHLYTNG